jgi:hypothetical protein
MTQSITPDFEDANVETDVDVPSDELELEVNDDANLDVDTPADDELDEVAQESGSDATPKAKANTTPRTKAPEGFVKPVEFAKILSDHLSTPEAPKVVPPQVVYSYIKNNAGESAKNPFPVHEVEGYAWYIKPEEGLAWWDAKNSRVSAAKVARATKEAAKAAKATAPVEAEGESSAPVVEAE